MPTAANTQDAPTGAAPERSALPYLPFDTFRNFVDSLGGGRPLPPRIDRSLMAGMAGGTQTLLLGTLVTFQLIGDNREVLPRFRDLVHADSDLRPELMATLLHETYREPMLLARDHATADQLAECFRVLSGYQGSTLRKAITFFLNMAKYSQVEVSPFFRPPPQNVGPRKPAARLGPVTPISPDAVAASASAVPASTAVESRSLDLVSGGTVTVSCSVSFLSLSRSDRDFLFELVDRLDAYNSAPPSRAGDGPPASAFVSAQEPAAQPAPTDPPRAD